MQDLVINFVSEDFGQEVLSIGKSSDSVHSDYDSYSLTENPSGIILTNSNCVRFIPWTSIIDFTLGEEYD